MKKLFILLILVALLAIKSLFTTAQISIDTNINYQPLWGPISYDHVEYYYLPEYEMYYYAPWSQFVYKEGNKWLFSNQLPNHYRHADLFKTYKVVINETKPYLKNDFYANRFKQYKHEYSKQNLIRDSYDPKYTSRIDHPNRKMIKLQFKKTLITGTRSDNKNSSTGKAN